MISLCNKLGRRDTGNRIVKCGELPRLVDVVVVMMFQQNLV